MRFRVLSGLLLLAASFTVSAASDLYGEINRLRAGQGDCAFAGNLVPLKPQAALERAAGDLANGGSLQQSLQAAGYRANDANAFSIIGVGASARADEILKRQSFCPKLQNPAMTDVGVYQGGSQVWVVMASPFAPSVGMSGQAAGERVLALVNQARATPRNCGGKAFNAAQPVRWNETLAMAARQHAEDMALNNYFGHTGHDGSEPAQRVVRAGYRYRSTGENIAGGPSTPEEAVADWIRSPGHCSNLMNPEFTDMGVGYAIETRSDMGVYWSQTFGAPR